VITTISCGGSVAGFAELEPMRATVKTSKKIPFQTFIAITPFTQGLGSE
jgi:hypothetical protein